MKHGTTPTLASDATCPNCGAKDFDVKTVTEIYGFKTYGCVRAKCNGCKCVYVITPFEIIEPLNEEVKDNV